MIQVVQEFRAFVEGDEPRERATVVPCMGDDAALSEGSPGAKSVMQRHLLVLRFALFNLAAFALLGGAYAQGWVNTVYLADSTGLTVVIFGVFLGGLVLCAGKIWVVSAELNCVGSFDPCRESAAAIYLAEVAGRGSGSRAITGVALRVRLANRVAVVRPVANSLVLFGLIGTVLGFVIALSGVESDAAGDVSAIAPMVTDLIGGMSVALYTTLVGAVLNLWLMVNYHVLTGGTVKLATSLIGLGESNARPRPV